MEELVIYQYKMNKDRIIVILIGVIFLMGMVLAYDYDQAKNDICQGSCIIIDGKFPPMVKAIILNQTEVIGYNEINGQTIVAINKSLMTQQKYLSYTNNLISLENKYVYNWEDTVLLGPFSTLPSCYVAKNKTMVNCYPEFNPTNKNYTMTCIPDARCGQ